jgi:hypothetical protein
MGGQYLITTFYPPRYAFPQCMHYSNANETAIQKTDVMLEYIFLICGSNFRIRTGSALLPHEFLWETYSHQ